MKRDELLSNMKLSPTTYPEVNAILNELLPNVQGILGKLFVGMYLHGSLAVGSFDQDSDVDFVVITAEALPEAFFSELQGMHARLATLDSWCATQLDGFYTPQNALRNFDPVNVLHLHIDRGPNEQLHRMQINDVGVSQAWWGGWVLLRSALREKGVTLAGPAPETLMDLVTPDELKQATLAILKGWVVPLLDQKDQIENSGWQSYTVLTLCRLLYTLEFGTIVSKQKAARWAQETLSEPTGALIDSAWLGRHNPQTKATKDEVDGTLDFIRYTLDRINQ